MERNNKTSVEEAAIKETKDAIDDQTTLTRVEVKLQPEKSVTIGSDSQTNSEDVAANIVEGLKAEINGDKEDRLSKINQKIRDDSTPTFDEDKLKISLETHQDLHKLIKKLLLRKM